MPTLPHPRRTARSRTARLPDPPTTVLLAGVTLALGLVAVHGLNAVTGDRRLLSLDTDASLTAWTQTALFLLAAVATAAVAVVRPGARAAAAGLAVVLLAFSVEQSVSLHNDVERSTADPLTTLLWQSAALAVVALVVERAARVAATPAATRLLRGALVALVGAWLASTANTELAPDHAVVVALSTVEETGETLLGVLLLSAATADLVGRVRLVRD